MPDKEKIEKIKKAKKDWHENKVEPTVSRFSERKDEFKVSSNFEVDRVYSPLDIEDKDYLDDINFPGQFPYTRGVYPTMYRGRLWTMRQYAGFGTAKESNERYKYLLDQGQSGLSVAFDLPTQLGYDSDDDIAEGEVGKVGVAIDSLSDMETLFDEIPLDEVSTSMTINAPAAVLLAMYIAVAEKQGVSTEKLRGTIQNDILKEYIARGTYIYPTTPSMRLITDIFEYCSENIPNWNTISISGYHVREAGCTAAQEIAFTLANGIAYVEAAIEAGLDVDDFAPRLSFFFNAHNNFLEEISKFRAARSLWAKIMENRFEAKKEKSKMLRFHTQTAGSTLTAQQSDNNIVRVTLQALAAVLGGTQSLHTNGRDEALSLPTEKSVEIALRTQQIIAHESGVADTADALGGSYYIEKLTDDLQEKAEEYINKIDDLGGAPEAIDQGYIQKEIQDSAYSYQKEIEAEKKIIVGVNKFKTDEELNKDILKLDKEVANQQKNRVAQLREDRDQAKVEATLKDLKDAAESDQNLMPKIVAAVKAYATLGEICDVMREVFGEYNENIIL